MKQMLRKHNMISAGGVYRRPFPFRFIPSSKWNPYGFHFEEKMKFLKEVNDNVIRLPIHIYIEKRYQYVRSITGNSCGNERL